MSSLSPAEYKWHEVSEPIGFSPAELEYAGRAAVDHFLKNDPREYIADLSPTIRHLQEKDMSETELQRQRRIRGFGPQPFPGLNAIIMDDLEAELEGKKPKKAKKDYYTIAVRYLRGHNLSKAYTYRVKKGGKVHLGQEIVVPTTTDGYTANTIAVVVEIHKTPQDNGPYDYKYVHGTVKPL